MPAYKYKTEEARQRHLAYRREYYHRNREKIRERDNVTAKRNRHLKKEKYAEYAQRHKSVTPKSTGPVLFRDNPDRLLIETEIEREREAEMSERLQV